MIRALRDGPDVAGEAPFVLLKDDLRVCGGRAVFDQVGDEHCDLPL